VRSDPALLRELLAPDFYEIGQSGRRWSRDEIIAALVSEPRPDAVPTMSERQARLISPDTVLLSYRLQFGERASLRSSLWKQTEDSVQCFFHQGTSVSAG
jgi:ribonuclease HI